MNFKRIEMYGFKSFADKLEIKFDNGITGIVGPNGCGKSNVADSIRWVLGEQSAKTLRGSNMMDVIFNGTASRKSLSYCEVSLVFDNENRRIPLDYSEIAVTRKLYRSGESEYLINRTPCRLKDIVDLLRDMGVAKDGYTVIGQGKVDEIINSKPEDRRGIFEEACGISKFKQRKLETERKLGRTHDNLLRLNDIITELERQAGPLQKQSEAAKKFLELKEHLKYHELNSFIAHAESVNEKKDKINRRLAALEEELSLRRSEHSQAGIKYDACMEEVSGIDLRIAELRDAQLELSLGLEKQSGEIRLIREKTALFRESLARLESDGEQLSSQREYLKQSISDKTAQKRETDTELEDLRAENQKVTDKYLSVLELLTASENVTESAQREVVVTMERLSEIKSNLSSLQAEKRALESQKSGITAQAEKLDAERARAGGELEQLKLQLSDIDSAHSRALAEREALVLENSTLQIQAKSLRDDLYSLDRHKSALSAKLNMLQRIQDNFEGYHRSVKQLLSDSRSDLDLQSRIIGTVAQQMSVPQKLELAIEVSLGQAMQNIIVHEEQDAKYLIAYLKNRKYGRITFLPVETVKGRTLDGATTRMLSSLPGCLGVASQLITFRPELQSIYDGLLGRTVIAETIDHAIAIARKLNYSVRIVSLDGDIIHPFGAMTGGSRAVESSNLLGGERELTETSAEISRLEKQLAMAQADLSALEEQQRTAADGIKRCDEAVRAAEVSRASASERLEYVQSLLEDAQRRASLLAQENYAISNRLDAIESDLKLVEELSGSELMRKDSAAETGSKRREEFDRYKLQRDELMDRMTAGKVRIAELAASSASLESELLRLNSDLAEILSQEEKNSRELASTREVIDQLIKSEGDVKLGEAEQRRLDDIRQKIAGSESGKREVQQSLSLLGEQREQLNAEISRLSELKIREESGLERVDTDLEFLQEKIMEEYGLDYEGASAHRAEDYDAPAGATEITRTKRQISALGYVNVAAIEDYKVLKERYDEMDGQRIDLEQAEDDLRQIIKELTTEMLERFTKGFAEISVNFQKTFKELFGGGNARLVLEQAEDRDPLSAGIDIVAEPPGKKLQSITLLSGGEKALTAIAILFSILKLRPMPFCVLDEIEAALDDANTERFARYLKKFSDETQFIVITHKKPTMELTDALYGVTMEEKGVSKMVSVKLAEAIQVAATTE